MVADGVKDEGAGEEARVDGAAIPFPQLDPVGSLDMEMWD